MVRACAADSFTVIAVTVAQFAITYLGPLQRVFATKPVAVPDGFLIVAIGAAFFALLEIEKQLHLTFSRQAA
jgi:hypothetical protein